MHLTKRIGNHFEQFFHENFPGFQNTTDDFSVPDFYNQDLGFWIETKAGYHEWGPRLKGYQINNFLEIQEPIVYALGYHDFHTAIERLKNLRDSEQEKILEEELNFLEIDFVSNDLIKKIWRKERRISKAKNVKYCTLKGSILGHIYHRRKFRRGSKNVPCAEKYYEFDARKYLIFPPVQNGFKCPVGILLNQERETRVIEYLKKRGIIKTGNTRRHR